MREQMEVSWLPSYGPEMRSGSAHCHVTLSHQRIGTPLVSQPEVLVAMNEPSLRKFGATVKAGGVLLYNGRCLPEDLAFEGVTVACVPANEIAESDWLGQGGQRGDAGRVAGGNRLPAVYHRAERVARLGEKSEAGGDERTGAGSGTEVRGKRGSGRRGGGAGRLRRISPKKIPLGRS